MRAPPCNVFVDNYGTSTKVPANKGRNKHIEDGSKEIDDKRMKKKRDKIHPIQQLLNKDSNKIIEKQSSKACLYCMK